MTLEEVGITATADVLRLKVSPWQGVVAAILPTLNPQ